MIPLVGIKTTSKNTLRDKPIIVVIKVLEIIPIPFSILDKVVPKYKSGQSQERLLRKVPDNSLWKNKYPSSPPKIKKTKVQNNPINRLYFMVFSVMLFIYVFWLEAFASDMEGSKRTDNEFVTVEGNISRDMDIPINTP